MYLEEQEKKFVAVSSLRLLPFGSKGIIIRQDYGI
jgi:hypothetical protein